MSVKDVIEAWKDKDIGTLLRELYIDENKSIRDISEELKVSVGYVHKLLKEYNIVKNIDLFGKEK